MKAYLLSLLCLLAPHARSVPPEILSVDPVGVWVNQGQSTLTVNGRRFTGGEVRWDGKPLQTTVVNTDRVTASVPASFLTTAASHQITVFVPGTTGGTSNAVTFDVSNPAPTLSSISPTSAEVFSALVTVTVNGSNFVPGSVVRFRGSAKQTTFVSATRLTAALSVADLANVGTGAITVVTPGPGGGTSSGANFTVVHPVPTITALAPSFRTVGTTAFTLTVDGTDFFAGSNTTVFWNGSARTTTFVNANRVTASILASDVAATGTANVTVRTRTNTTAQTSAPAVFSITARLTVLQPITTVLAQPVATVNLAPQVQGPAGGSGGNAFNRDCGAGQVMSGVNYRAGLVVDALALLCRPVRADGTLGTEGAVGTALGGGGPFTRVGCTATRVINKITVFSGVYVDGFVINCVPWDPATRRFDPNDQSLVIHTVGRAFFTTGRTFECNAPTPQQPVRGIHGRAQDVIDALGITCDEP